MDQTENAPAQEMTNPSSSIIGMTQCDKCGRRYQVKKKLEGLIGKTVKCPKCFNMFTLQIEKSTPTEVAAISQSQSGQENQTVKGKRKPPSQVRQEFIKNIKNGFRKMHGHLESIAQAEQSSEEQVRIWCIDALKNCLGYEYEQIDTEYPVLGKKVDIAIKKDGKVFMVIECKSINGKLNSARDQVVGYAIHLNVEWAVATSGGIWKLYRVFPKSDKEKQSIEVFDIALLDEDGVSDDDAEYLYLLTAKAIFKGETADEADLVASLSEANILSAIKSERVLGALRRQLVEQYEEQTGIKVKLDDDHVYDHVEEFLSSKEL